MARIPFKRVAEAFDETARARLCGSSGSEHSAADDSSPELSDLINSFMENDDRSDEHDEEEIEGNDKGSSVSQRNSFYGSETSNKELLLLSLIDVDDVKDMIRSQTQLAVNEITLPGGTNSTDGLKRQLMNRLRERGLDAGLCKSRWKKIGNFPAGDYEYIDVMVNETRYIVEVNLAGEFVIARPTGYYQSLLDVFPPIFVGESDNLKQVVKLMCTALKKSLKNSDIHMPPWRKNGYMLAKWFGSYKRTTNAVARKRMNVLADRRSVGFQMTPTVFNYCGDGLRSNEYLRVGNLAQAFGGTNCN
ncbi:hypothetical protein ACHQM5_002680 [Ranunculus cassubicifolius]